MGSDRERTSLEVWQLPASNSCFRRHVSATSLHTNPAFQQLGGLCFPSVGRLPSSPTPTGMVAGLWFHPSVRFFRRKILGRCRERTVTHRRSQRTERQDGAPASLRHPEKTGIISKSFFSSLRSLNFSSEILR